MTYIDAAYSILKAAGQPLHYEEITARAGSEADLATRADARRDHGLAPVTRSGTGLRSFQSASRDRQAMVIALVGGMAGNLCYLAETGKLPAGTGTG